ncbi:MAG: carboxypeptidase-like regulatory domain-containing protein [Candidatus Margulisiibacteriota bacterium]
MERIIRRVWIVSILCLLGGLFLLTGCGGVSDDTTEKATLTGTYQLQEFPSGPWDAITVAISGPEVVASQTTDSLGKYSVKVKASGAYTIQASKSGYFTSTKTIVVSSVQTYTVSTDILYQNTAPSQPTMNY